MSKSEHDGGESQGVGPRSDSALRYAVRAAGVRREIARLMGGGASDRTARKYRNRPGRRRTWVHSPDGGLRLRTPVDGLPLDGMKEVWGSKPHSSTRNTRSECISWLSERVPRSPDRHLTVVLGVTGWQ